MGDLLVTFARNNTFMGFPRNIAWYDFIVVCLACVLYATIHHLSVFNISITLTCICWKCREMVPGHSDDEEDDQRPDEQSQGPQLQKVIHP